VRHRSVWPKVILIVLILILPLAFLGYLTVSQEWARFTAEKQRLAGLRYLEGLRNIIEHLQQHRTASLGLLGGEENFRPALVVFQDLIDDDLDEMDQLEEQFGRTLGTAEMWAALHDNWEDLRAQHWFKKPEESSELHRRFLASVLGDVARIADDSRLVFVNGSRHYLNDTLAFRLLPQIEVLGQVHTLATGTAIQKSISLPHRAQLLALTGQLKVLGDAVRNNSESTFDHDPTLEDSQDALVFDNTIACNQFVDFLNASLLDPPRIDVVPAAVLESGQKPRTAAFRLFDAQLASVLALTQQEIDRSRRDLGIAGIGIGACLLLSVVALPWLASGLRRQPASAIADSYAQLEKDATTSRTRVLAREDLSTKTVEIPDVPVSRQPDEGIAAALARLQEEIQGVAAGDLTCQAEEGDEITSSLAQSFNHMNWTAAPGHRPGAIHGGPGQCFNQLDPEHDRVAFAWQ